MSYPDVIDLAVVNKVVNQLPYVADAQRYGMPEWWARIDAEGGDCEDFALGKLVRLRALGWPIEKLRLACCMVETGEYHAVLAVDIDAVHQVVLDNRQHAPQGLGELMRVGYRPDRIQRTGGSREWCEWFWTNKEQ